MSNGIGRVWAANAGDDEHKPNGVGSVWIENIDALTPSGGGGAGDVEVNTLVHTNSASWDTVTNKLDTTAFSSVSGTFLTAHQDLSNYATTADLASKQDTLTFGYDEQNKISAINNSAIAGGQGNSDTFIIIPGTTTNKEVSENSGKNMLLYMSGSNEYLPYAGKTSYSNYSIFSFKNLSGTQSNYNYANHVRMNIWPASTSACTLRDTNSVSLLDTNSTVNQASTAYYDGDGNSLAQTHYDLTALNSFVQSNSASWGQGGGGSTGASIPLRINYQVSEEYGNKYTNYYLSSDGSTFLFTAYDEGYTPTDLIINGNNYSWSYNNGRWEIEHSINGQESVDLIQAGLQYSGQDIIQSIPMNNISAALNKVIVNTTNGSITGSITLYDQNNSNLTISSFTGNWSGYIPSSYNGYTVASYNVDAGAEYYGNDYGFSIDVYSEANGGSTVASGDVFPPTNNLDPYTTYYLGWNANNGGLGWYSQGGN